MKKPTVVDLFCGVGGMTHGFIREKFDVVAGIDNDLTCKYSYEKNNNSKFICKDIKNVTGKDLDELYPKKSIRILIGCAPCQPFSNYNNKKSDDDKWTLLYEFIRLINETEPEIISMENVPQIIKHSIFGEFVNSLKNKEYNVFWKIVHCPAYGIPQNRKRLVLLASKFGEIFLKKESHSPSRYKVVKDVILHLPPLKAGEINNKDRLHSCRDLSPINHRRITKTSEGSGWHEWDESLILPCHKRKRGKTYKSVYGRMKWDEPSPTITTQFYGYGSGKFGHPTQNRALSYREGALLQTFPKKYKFIDPKAKFSGKAIGRHIGNAVPVRLGQIIAQSIKNHINTINDE